MFRFGKRQVKELGAGTISFPDKTISHAASGFVVVARPAAIEINMDSSLWLFGNALQ